MAEKYAQDPVLGGRAKEVAEKLKSIFVSKGLIATASHKSENTKNAFDGNSASRWDTGTPMRPGMWFVIDLGIEQAVKKIILDTRGSPGDYPRGSEIYVSFDGKNWSNLVLKVPAQGVITTYAFPKPQHARFIKIVQTGRTDGLFWSIHELKIDVK